MYDRFSARIALLIIWGVLAVFLARGKQRISAVSQIGDESLTDSILKKARGIEGPMRSLGFRHVGSFRYDSMAKHVTYFRLYSSADNEHSLMLAETHAEGAPPMMLVEFNTSLLLHGELMTNDNKHSDVFSHPDDMFIIKMPWEKSVVRLYETHLQAFERISRQGFAANRSWIEEPLAYVRFELVKSMLYQVKKKRMKQVSADEFRFTLWGAFLGVPGLALQILNPLLGWLIFGRRRKIDFDKIEHQAMNARAMNEEDKTYWAEVVAYETHELGTALEIEVDAAKEKSSEFGKWNSHS